jgi:hypothetical protein
MTVSQFIDQLVNEIGVAHRESKIICNPFVDLEIAVDATGQVIADGASAAVRIKTNFSLPPDLRGAQAA